MYQLTHDNSIFMSPLLMLFIYSLAITVSEDEVLDFDLSYNKESDGTDNSFMCTTCKGMLATFAYYLKNGTHTKD